MALSTAATRNRIALLVISAWLGVPAAVVFAVLVGAIQSNDVQELDFFRLWSDFSTPVATLIMGYYFGLPHSPAGAGTPPAAAPSPAGRDILRNRQRIGAEAVSPSPPGSDA